jgi:hypothetical protein
MWAMLKSPILLGNDLAAMSDTTLGVLSNREVLAISGDPWGVQARRVLSIPPPAANYTKDNLGLLAPCNASDPLQKWRYRAASGPSAKRMLRVITCNASDPYQQWERNITGMDSSNSSRTRATSSYGLVNIGLRLALDSSVGGSYKWETRAPLGFAAFTGAAAQLWSNSSIGKLTDSQDGQCLNVVSFTGPDVGLDPCKPSGTANDGNEIFSMKDSRGVIQITNARSGGKCLAASTGPAGGYLYTIDEAGADWCLMADGGKGSLSTSMSGQLCSAVEAASATPPWQPGKFVNHTVASLSFGGGGNTLTWGNRQFGASGPLPHHIYLQANPWGNTPWHWPEALTTMAGAALQLPAGVKLTDDDHIGGVKQVDSSTMCVALTRCVPPTAAVATHAQTVVALTRMCVPVVPRTAGGTWRSGLGR